MPATRSEAGKGYARWNHARTFFVPYHRVGPSRAALGDADAESALCLWPGQTLRNPIRLVYQSTSPKKGQPGRADPDIQGPDRRPAERPDRGRGPEQPDEGPRRLTPWFEKVRFPAPRAPVFESSAGR